MAQRQTTVCPADRAGLEQQGELQVGEAAAHTDPGTLAVDGHAAADHQVHGVQLGQADPPPGARRTGDGGGTTGWDAKTLRVEQDEGVLVGQAGTARYSSLPSARARARTGSCGASGLALTTRAVRHGGSEASRAAAAGAPAKLGIHPWAPGKRATRSRSRRDQTRSRTACLALAASSRLRSERTLGALRPPSTAADQAVHEPLGQGVAGLVGDPDHPDVRPALERIGEPVAGEGGGGHHGHVPPEQLQDRLTERGGGELHLAQLVHHHDPARPGVRSAGSATRSEAARSTPYRPTQGGPGRPTWARTSRAPDAASTRKPSLRPPVRSSPVMNPPTGAPASRSSLSRRQATVVLPIPGRPSSSSRWVSSSTR
jgi:hypothetical protein